MEQEFYRDEFEQLLKDTTEDFKMYPSRKVWHSIYNDLHPDRKWPSLAVCLLLLTTILYVGVTNNNAINTETKRNTVASLNYHFPAANTFTSSNLSPATGSKTPGVPVAAEDNNEMGMVPDDIASGTLKTREDGDISVSSQNSSVAAKITGINNEVIAVNNLQLPADNHSTGLPSNGSVAKVVNMSKRSLTVTKDPVDNSERVNEADAMIPTATDEMLTIAVPDLNTGKAEAKQGLLLSMQDFKKDTREKEWIEDFAFYNKKKPSRSLKGVSTQFYVAPSIGYRVMFKNKRYDNINNNALVSNSAARNEETDKEINQQAALNMEAGFGLMKDLGKKWRVKGGLQFNYTDFITYAQQLDHPTQTAVVLHDPATGFLSLTSQNAGYSNTPGKNINKLHNKTIQLSIPVGVDHRILNTPSIAWYVGATIQPTYVVAGHSYLQSADNNYFVEDQSMIRKWNLNAALESFVSIKTKSGTNINLGPQFRYQLISTFNKEYIYTQKPYSVGFKIGFTRPL